MERHFSDRIQQDSYAIGVVGGFVYGNAAQSRWSVAWAENTLRMHWQNVTASGETTSLRTEVWELRNDGRLEIRIESRAGDGAVSETVAYRREGQ